MATFPSYNPQYSATKRSQSNLRITQFGDGYQQRTTFGLNQDPKVWNLTFNVDDEDADEIEWICRSFSREIFEFDRNRISASFEEVFEP